MLYILSNVTVDGPFLKNTLSRLAGRPVMTTPGYDTWMADLLRADFGGNVPEAVFLVVDGTALLDGECLADRSRLRRRLDECLAAVAGFRQRRPDIPLFATSIDVRRRLITPLAAERAETFAMSLWRDGLHAAGVPVVELAELAHGMGAEKFYDDRTWYFGKMPFSMSGEKALARELHRAWLALSRPPRKVLVLDLDNTLWGGVAGEDGVAGIRLAEAAGGGPFRDFQRRLLDLKRMGVLLAVASKNNEADVLPVFDSPDSILRRDDFAAFKADWRPKPETIREIALDLNLGPDSFVFVDDNPLEREAVAMALPEVAVADFPAEPEALPGLAAALASEYFSRVAATAEDADKTGQYRAEASRQAAKSAFADFDDYLASLELRLNVRILGDGDIPRAAQLTQKTNQFTLTTRRYTEGEIAGMLRSGEWKGWMGSVSDKYGDYGATLLCLARLEDGVARIDTFLMSCRVMGRNVEFAFLSAVEESLEGSGCRRVVAEYLPTPKNAPAADFWSRAGYARESDGRYALTPPARGRPAVAVSVALDGK